MTQTLTTIGHRTAFNNEQSPYRIVSYKKALSYTSGNIFFKCVKDKMLGATAVQRKVRNFTSFLTVSMNVNRIIIILFNDSFNYKIPFSYNIFLFLS